MSQPVPPWKCKKRPPAVFPWFAGAWPWIALAIASGILAAEAVTRCGAP